MYQLRNVRLVRFLTSQPKAGRDKSCLVVNRDSAFGRQCFPRGREGLGAACVQPGKEKGVRGMGREMMGGCGKVWDRIVWFERRGGSR